MSDGAEFRTHLPPEYRIQKEAWSCAKDLRLKDTVDIGTTEFNPAFMNLVLVKPCDPFSKPAAKLDLSHKRSDYSILKTKLEKLSAPDIETAKRQIPHLQKHTRRQQAFKKKDQLQTSTKEFKDIDNAGLCKKKELSANMRFTSAPSTKELSSLFTANKVKTTVNDVLNKRSDKFQHITEAAKNLTTVDCGNKYAAKAMLKRQNPSNNPKDKTIMKSRYERFNQEDVQQSGGRKETKSAAETARKEDNLTCIHAKVKTAAAHNNLGALPLLEMKAFLKASKLPVSGNKATLQARIDEFLSSCN